MSCCKANGYGCRRVYQWLRWGRIVVRKISGCINCADVGSLTNASITFSNLTSLCGSPTSFTYSSGAINSSINDNSCAAGTASIFSVPQSTDFTTPITVNATTTLLWTNLSAVAITNATNANASAVSPVGTTDYILTTTTTFKLRCVFDIPCNG